jgi:hypothetical protein
LLQFERFLTTCIKKTSFARLAQRHIAIISQIQKKRNRQRKFCKKIKKNVPFVRKKAIQKYKNVLISFF